MVHWTSFLPVLGSAFSIAAAATSKTPTAEVVPGAYIVELADNHDSDSFYNTLGIDDVAVKHRMKLDYKLFKGTSFQLKNVSDVDAAAAKIANMDIVKQIWPVRIFHVPNDEVIWKGTDRNLAEVALQKRQSGGDTNDTFSTHVMTQVDQLRAQGITGKGTKVAVIDTGIDYLHPALGGGFGDGYLVAYGTDLVGDNYNGQNTPVPDDDPIDVCEGHGTHVAGIVAAQANPFGFTGAAPDVTLGAYRVFGCGGSAGNDVLIAAYNQAFEDGSDIITASIGGASGWTEDPWAVAVSRIVGQGVPCLVSAGNDGDQGLFYASTAANGKGVTAVASVDNIEAPEVLTNASYTTGNSSSEVSFGWTPGTPANWGNISLPLWNVNNNANDTANGCTAYPDDAPDLSEYVVLIRRGSCTFVQKATNAAAKGAKYILFYNNVDGLISVSAGGVTGIVATGMVTAEQGEEWIALLASGTVVTVNIIDPTVAPNFVVSEPNTATGGFLSTYTSWGPTFEVDVKPQLAAPGGLILSTYPRALGAYAVLSGTSMACPLAAAITALVAEVRGTFDPAELESVLSATSNPNLFNDGTATFPYLAPVAQQGSGLLQAYDAAYTKTVLSVSSISFNDTDNLIESTNFTIRNTGTEETTYSIANVIAASGYTLEAGTIFPALFPNELVAEGAELTFSGDKVTVPAGGEVAVQVEVTPPALSADRLPVYSGYITLNGTNGDSLSLPYLGVVGSLHDATVLSAAETVLTRSDDPNSAPIAANQTFTIPSNNGTAPNGTVYPELFLALALGSPLINIEVLPQGTGGYNTSSLGSIHGFPQYYLPRGGSLWPWNGQLEDGSFAPAGTYALKVSALHIFGDASDEDEYDTKTTVSFNIQYV